MPSFEAASAIAGDGAPSVVEVSDDGLGDVRELVERCNNLPMWEVCGFIQAYLRGDLNLGLLYTLGDQTNYGFIWSAAHEAGTRNGSECFRGAPPAGNLNLSRLDIDGHQSLVLSDDVQQMEGIQKSIPSLVRFQRFDDTSFLDGEGLYEFMPLVIPSRELLLAGSDGKVSIVNKRLAVAVRQCAGEDIEAATNGINVSASLDLERERQRLFFSSQNNIIRDIGWRLFDDHIEIVFKPGIRCLSEGWEFGYGPIDRRLSMQ